MARRKGWDQLSENYQRRLLRQGINEAAYESGVNLQKARGHDTPGGVGEKTYIDLRRIAEKFSWHPDESGKDMVDEAIAQGESPQWIRERLAERQADTRAYRKGKPESGKANWSRRKPYLPSSWYWYH